MLAMLVAVAVGLTFAQAPGQDYAGTWIAEQAGTTYVRLELTIADGALQGKIALGNIHVNADGEVDSAEPAPATLTPIFDLVAKPADLSFARQDGTDIDNFRMTLTATGADLTLLLDEAQRQELTRAGVPTPKPLRLTRQR